MNTRPSSIQTLFLLGSILFSPLLLLYATQVIWLQNLGTAFSWMLSHGQAVLLFWVLCSTLSLTIYGFTRRMVFAYLPQAVVFVALALISYYKFAINGAPLQLSDFTFIGNMGDIAAYAGAQLAPTLVTICAVLLVIALLVLLWRTERWRPTATSGFILGSLCMVTFFSALYPGILQASAIQLEQGCYDQEERNEQLGVVLGLYSAWSQRLNMENATDNETVSELTNGFRGEALAPAGTTTAAAPDIIFVTSESFFDVTRLPGLTFEQDPLPVFHALSETCTNGRFLSNTYGGGTGNVEMEMFTGLTASCLKEGDALSTLPPETYEQLPTTVRLLKQQGYQTTALHPHTDALYNRRTNYPRIGFDEVLFVEDFMTTPLISGEYISDLSFAEEIIARYESRDPSAPSFIYGMSMENHQSYTPEKYGVSSGFPAQSDKLSGEDLAILDSLVMGLHGADASLGRLVQYFSQVDRPVLLVFVGDHLPSLNLSDGASIYTHLGISPSEEASDWDAQTLFEILTTDYLIWSNYETAPQTDRTESCTMLGLRTLERAGLPLNGYFAWLKESVSPYLLFSRNKLFVGADGTPSYEVPMLSQAVLETYTAVERNLLYNIGGTQP